MFCACLSTRLPSVVASVIAAMVATVTTLVTTSVSAQDKHAAMVVDANTGNVMHAEQADEPRYPASLTKIMTLYMAFEAIEQGRTSYATRIKVSHEAASAPPTKLDLDPGETISLIDAMRALVTKSANDAAIAIAEHLGGTEPRFARQMTDKARLFGMSRTTFRNASGLPDPEQVTTARDMIRLALRIQDDFPQHYHLFSTRSFAYDGSTHRNHNNLLYRFQGTDGIKTGYTRASGFNLVTSVRRGGRHVVGAIFGGRTAGRRDDAMQLLLSRALIRSTPYKTRRSAPVLVAAATPAQRPRPTMQPEAAPAPPPIERQRPQQFANARADFAPRSDVEADRPRPVMVPSRARIETPVIDAASQWPGSTPVNAPTPVLAARPQAARATTPAEEPSQRFAFAPRGMDLSATRAPPTPEPAPTPARGAPPSTFQHQAVTLARGNDATIAPPRPERARGQPPSTFQQQAGQQQAGQQQAGQQQAPLQQAGPPRANDAYVPPSGKPMPAPYAVRGPEVAAVTTGGYEVQIGAYATSGEAERALSVARGNAGDLLRPHASRAVLVAKEARQIFRARFVGFDSRSAASTCIELRRRQVDCFVMRAE